MMRRDGSVQKRVWLFLIVSWEIMIWVSLAQARPWTQVQEANSTTTKDRGIRIDDNVERLKEMARVGSRPPNCEHKCWGCEPCMAIQVPTTTDQLSPQYANYEPEGWKCKCGSTFYNP
ncbi:uncharacterized protein A4U43_C01F23720 [Asparagus officinalis]|uniref:Epidermal patterning factor-like protein n=1 Tax=Asparagus officinalis TaxID=4686 RepID=A0A5P1FV73_ASPOF|nr:EPIDERMAL PATTERNING FACTOR-like protein 3 [Asparagus officinalis]ONK80959.1 uncharacterized protein A4U43_C01F23720 [Asparagus officinalis]